MGRIAAMPFNFGKSLVVGGDASAARMTRDARLPSAHGLVKIANDNISATLGIRAGKAGENENIGSTFTARINNAFDALANDKAPKAAAAVKALRGEFDRLWSPCSGTSLRRKPTCFRWARAPQSRRGCALNSA
jgi:hypothetical protein